MSPRLLAFIRASYILLALVLFAQLLPTAAAFTNGQAASLVLGQPDFTSNARGTTASGMYQPVGVAIDPTTGKLFVADTSNNRVLRFASGAALVSGAEAEGVLGQPDFTSNNSTTSPIGMFYPIGVALDSAGRLWVADFGNNRVLRFDSAATKPNGATADGVLGQPDFFSGTICCATSASEMSSPAGVAVDSAGRLWVADTSNSRVLRFDGAAAKANGATADGVLGQPNFTNSATATSSSGMRGPRGVVVDNADRLWVADWANNRVLRFDDAASKANGATADGLLGQLDFSGGDPATSASGMFYPSGVVAESNGRLWIADWNNNRVLRFDSAAGKPNGAAAEGVLGQPDFITVDTAITASVTFHPFGGAIDSAGSLWVADSGSNRVLRFDRATTPTITWANPTAISYGSALGVEQLNASANVPGSFSYSPPLGTVLNVGTNQTLSVTFTPTNSADYSPATKTVTIDVVMRLYLPPTLH